MSEPLKPEQSDPRPAETVAAGSAPTPAPSGLVARIIGACGRRPGLVVGLTFALALLGVAAGYSTPLDALPDLTDTQVIVATEWMSGWAAAPP